MRVHCGEKDATVIEDVVRSVMFNLPGSSEVAVERLHLVHGLIYGELDGAARDLIRNLTGNLVSVAGSRRE